HAIGTDHPNYNLAAVAARPGDPGAADALAELTRALADDRVIPELPDLPPFSAQALAALRRTFRATTESRDPAVWRGVQERWLADHAAAPRPVIPLTDAATPRPVAP
ncbi:MAG: hypothetical protein ACOCX4_10790, partial [Planctomycetota bacterium]